MEAKLAAYRRRKEDAKQTDESLINKLKLVIINKSKETQSKGHNKQEESGQKSKVLLGNNQLPSLKRKSTPDLKNSDQQDVENEGESNYTSKIIKWTLRILKFLLWLTIWAFFIELQFGAVFFTISVLIFVYLNTRTGPKDNKPSAYSVFNKDCERIQGTLTAEQMQKQMFGVPGLPS